MSGETYDVVIVGAGIAGATAAKTIAESGGKRILILEAGRNTGMSADKYKSHVLAFHEASAKLPNSPYADNPLVPQPSEASVRKIEPGKPDDRGGYLVQAGPQAFASSYTRAFGGTTLHWLGTSLRMLPNDFRLRTRYGHGVDWPIGYDDLKPFYERAERDIIGVSGNVADQEYPGIDGTYYGDYEYPMERVPSSFLDHYLGDHIDGAEVRLGDETIAMKVCNTPQGRNSTPRGDYRPVGAVGTASEGHRCEGNSSCIPICPVQAKYNALKTFSALQRMYPASGGARGSSVEILTQAVATKVELKDGRVDGITYKLYQDEDATDPANVKLETVRARVYVLAAHAIENAKLLLASGAANSSGQVGKNLMDHPLILTWGLLADKVWSYRGPGSTSGIPAFRDGEFRKEHSAFRVEIGNWGWSFATNAPYSTFDVMADNVDPARRLAGSQLRRRMSEVLPRQFRLAWEMEQIPEESNCVTIDDKYRDALGNHRPVIHYDIPEYVLAGMEAARRASRTVFERLGLTPLHEPDFGEPPCGEPGGRAGEDFPFARDYTFYGADQPGYVTYNGRGYAWEGAGHVAGTHRMGSAPANSVVNAKQQSWDHPNLFLVGCGNMPTLGTANPTLTMTALAIQAGEHVNDYLGA